MKQDNSIAIAATVLTLAMMPSMQAVAQTIKGTVTDKTTHETLVGAVVTVEGTGLKAVTDADGQFAIGRLKSGRYTLSINYIGYKPQRIDGVQAKAAAAEYAMSIALQPDEQQLKEVTVTAVERRNTDAAMIQVAKNSPVIVSNVSAQEINRTQDTNAGEVVRRVPGVSLIDDKFVMVRGLSQRYNNVWINGGAVPSSEADSRAFSFDIIPSSQIDNLTIIKSPSAEYPADYSGGFIIINTKEIPTENDLTISLGGNYNSATDFKNSLYANKGSWLVKTRKPVADPKLAASLNRRWKVCGHTLGMLAAANYTSEWRTYGDMQNNLYGIYDAANDRSNYLRQSVDNQYNHNTRLGGMLNLTLLSRSGNHKYQLKNIFNRLTTDRYTWREGTDAQSNHENSAEYFSRNRTTYNGQLTGKHTFTGDALDWSVGYAYANRRLPDRKRYLLNDIEEPGTIALHTGNDISREWTRLDEHIVSASVNDRHVFNLASWSPTLQAGAYGEYRTRKYTTRQYIYQWNPAHNSLPADFKHSDITQLLSDPANMGDDKLSMIEQLQMRNNYRGNNILGAAYLAADLPLGAFGVHAGLRFEHNDMELVSNTRDTEKSEQSRHYKTDDLFPSLNTTYKFSDKHQMRLSYGRSINRPEFREVSPSVFYDFDLASDVQGNTELKNCYVDNLDLRYEFYPSRGESVSLAAFYKHFDSPIEWTYTVAGGTNLIYSYKNARSANNYGLELDVRKDLSFIGLRGLSWSFNGALIKSRVQFEKGAREENRPMQGQSPYLVNTGFFYHNDAAQLDVALLYNRIGKRIIGVGRSEGSSASDNNARVPHSYEMPRNVIDLTLGKKFGQHWELKAYIRDLLAEKVYYKQFAKATYSDGSRRQIEEVSRCYKPGRNIGMQIIYKL